jgi:hypothetical protein
MAEVCKRVPGGVVCLISALQFHGLTTQMPFEGSTLTRAIRATFERRRTPIPKAMPAALSDEFVTNQEKVTHWKGFRKRTRLADTGVEFSQVIDDLRRFLIPPLQAAASGESFSQSWKEGGPWSKAERTLSEKK